VVTSIETRLDEPVDGASLAIFRIAFGALMVIASLRFFFHGWIDADYRATHVFFHYWGFGWVRPWPGIGMYLHYGVMAASAAAVMFGIRYRVAIVVFGLTFTYAHLCDKSNYLNHYYLVSLLAFLMAWMPLDRAERARRWMLLLLRFQVGVVYAFGGIGKLGADWLLRAEPLRIWLAADAEFPILGRFFNGLPAAYAFSWAGAIFDLSVVPLLLWPRTRRYAYAACIAFHVMTSLLFHIGMFPWIMLASATLMFDPSWPRRFIKSLPKPGADGPTLGIIGRRAAVLYVAIQLLLPLRAWLYPGNTLWTEEGFRFSWKVMLIEKSGALELNVVDAQGHHTLVEPRRYLTPFQTRMASTQPDMILELAHVVAADFERAKGAPVQVFADAQVSFNGRHRAPLIDPTVDLAQQEDSLAPKRWILPAPTTEPEF
jgi:hypothetical protein